MSEKPGRMKPQMRRRVDIRSPLWSSFPLAWKTVFLARSEILSLTRARQDPVRVDPKHYAVEFETDKVRVLRIKYGPGEKSVMHGHPAMVGVFLTDGKVRFAYPNGKVEDIKTQTGQVIYFDALENLVDKPLEVIGVELK